MTKLHTFKQLQQENSDELTQRVNTAMTLANINSQSDTVVIENAAAGECNANVPMDSASNPSSMCFNIQAELTLTLMEG